MDHDRAELRAAINAWKDAGRTCAPAICSERTKDGHEVSYVLTMGDYVHDVRMSCPDGAMTRVRGTVFACCHGEYDAEDLIPVSPLGAMMPFGRILP